MLLKRIALLFLLFALTLKTAEVALAADDKTETAIFEKHLYISSIENRPLSIDRLLYTAFNEIGCQITVTSDVMTSGFSMANTGEKDGVISGLPDMESVYPNLVKVPVVLEYSNVRAYVRAGDSGAFSGWNDLGGLNIGMLSQRVYLLSNVPAAANVTLKESYTQLMEGLAAGEYDVAVYAKRMHETLWIPANIIDAGLIEVFPEYLYLHKSHQSLIPEISAELAAMQADGRTDKIINDLPMKNAGGKKTILYITSVNTEVERESVIIKKIRDELKDNLTLDWYTVELNSGRFANDRNRLTYFANLLRQDCVSRDIAAIVVSGEEALDFIKEYYYLFFRNVPVVFYGIGNDYAERIAGYEDFFTGVVQHTDAYDTIALALNLFPETKTVHVINDATSEGESYRNMLEGQLSILQNRVDVVYVEDMSFDELRGYLGDLPDDAIVLIGSYFCDGDGQYYSQNETRSMLKAQCHAPVFTVYSTELTYNALGGKCPDSGMYGAAAASFLKRILNGESIADMPVMTDTTAFCRWVFDRSLLDIHTIGVGLLPKGSTIINGYTPIWEENLFFAVSMLGFLVISVIISACLLLYLNSYRKQNAKLLEAREHLHSASELLSMDARLRVVNDRLERIINTSPISFLLSIDNKVVEINESMNRDMGLSVGDDLSSLFADLGELELINEKLQQNQRVTNETVTFRMKNGQIHRNILCVSGVEYEGRKAFMLWALDIEENEVKKDQIMEIQRNLQMLVDMLPLPVAIVEADSYTMLYCNNTMLKMMELDPFYDVYGAHISDIFTKDGKGVPDIMAAFSTGPAAVSQTDLRIQTSKGKVSDVRIHASPIVYNGRYSVIGIMADLSSEKMYKVIQENLQTIIDSMPIPIRITSKSDMTVLYVNRRCMELFGYESPDDVLGKPVYTLMPEYQSDGMPTVEKIKPFLYSKNPMSMELEYLNSFGNIISARLVDCPIEYQGTSGNLGIIENLTAEREYARMLLNTAEKEKEANQLKSRFIVHMSHEIRTPMNAIIGLTEVELRKEQNDETRDIYKKISNSAKSLLDIINDILDLSKIEADKMELRNEDFELTEVLNSALLVASPRLEGKKVEFLLKIDAALPRFIRGDKTRLWQILKNFLDNAAKFTNNGHILLNVFADPEKSDDDTIRLRFVVSDTGIGINEEQLWKLFMPYEQIFNEAQMKYTGSGLGMSISKQLCELMGGSLDVKSVSGVGTTIYIEIPFKRTASPVTLRDALIVPELRSLDILLVDDDEQSLEIMKDLLELNGASCVCAGSGPEALEIIFKRRERGGRFDAILIDYMMDGMDGLETARQINMSLSRAPKLLILTAYQKQLFKRELERSGIEDTIEKPFLPVKLIQKLCQVLGIDMVFGEKSDRELELTQFDGVTVLLCEDNHLNQEVAVGMFRQLGIVPYIADHGKHALELLNGVLAGQQIDLIFMDLQMPVMDGYETTIRIRDDKRFNSVPIISLTADAMKEVVDKCLEMGMDDHIAKPVDFDSLHRILLKWLPEAKKAQGTKIAKVRTQINFTAPDPYSEGVARFGGKRNLYEKALLEFARELPDSWPSHDAVLAETETIIKKLHSIKGVAGNLVVTGVYQRSAQFEASLKEGNPEWDIYDLFIEECENFKMEALAKAEAEDGKTTEPVDYSDLSALFLKLRRAIADYNPLETTETVSKLRDRSWPAVADTKRLETLYKLAQGYEFDKALALLDSFEEEGI